MTALRRPDTSDSWEGVIETSGSRMYLRRSGLSGSLPTIVLEAGAGATSASWGWVQKRLAERTLVVSYDRAGLGASDIAPGDVDADATAARLEALLGASTIPGPYIFVGHSLGGLLAQYYAATHAEHTAALVLVDPTPSDRSLFPRGHDRFAPLYFALLRVVRALAWSGAFRLYNPFGPLFERSGLPPRETSDMIAALASPRHLRTVLRELKATASVQDCVNRYPVPKQIPLLVVTAGARTPQPDKGGSAAARFYAAALQNHKDAAARSAFGRHMTIQNANHNTLLTNREFAHELAEHILRFADECGANPAARGGTAGNDVNR